MESTLSATTTATTALLGVSKTLNYSNPCGRTVRSQFALVHFRRTTTSTKAEFRISSSKFGLASPLFGLRSVGGGVPPVRCRVECVSSYAASFASSSGDGGIGGGGYSGGGGGGGGGGDGGEVKVNPITGGADDGSALSSDVIILDVGVSIVTLLDNRP